MPRQLVYYVACTLDGFIARADGSYDWASFEGEHFADLFARFPETFPAPFREQRGIRLETPRFDTVLMGKATYEVGLRIGLQSPYAPLRQFVLSSTLPDAGVPDVHVHRGDPVGLVRELKAQPGKDIWLCGGGKLAGALADEIDELILKINPVLIGEGIPMLAGVSGTWPVTLIEHKTYANGFVLARYVRERR
jgi:dihydrofolate reductase